jgi:hypothetical protein
MGHASCGVNPNYVIKPFSDLRQLVVFLVSSTYKTDRYDIAETLLKVALNIIALTPRNRLS